MLVPLVPSDLSRFVSLLAATSIGLGCGGGAEPVVMETSASSMGAAPGVLFPGSGDDFSSEQGDPPAAPSLADFVAAEVGGWRLGAQLPGGLEPPDVANDARRGGCGSVLTGILRDIRESHPDFAGEITDLQRGLVQDALGADGKPVLRPNSARGFIQSAESFGEWYESVPGVNETYLLELSLEPDGGEFTFQSNAFFPLDGAGFGNEGQDHNFSFTFELHTLFRYSGGEVFEFSGDDDLWVFVNGRLAIDLGGVHEAAAQELDLDAEADRLGITVGNEYTLDFFQAERHSTESNFAIDTTLEFTVCGVNPR